MTEAGPARRATPVGWRPTRARLARCGGGGGPSAPGSRDGAGCGRAATPTAPRRWHGAVLRRRRACARPRVFKTPGQGKAPADLFPEVNERGPAVVRATLWGRQGARRAGQAVKPPTRFSSSSAALHHLPPSSRAATVGNLAGRSLSGMRPTSPSQG